jgi:hypothetical protein
MTSSAAFFARPRGDVLLLQVDPVLASWDAKQSASQQRLELFLGHATHMLAPRLARLADGPIALRMDVGVPDREDWLQHHDLDNFAYPLAMRLHQLADRQLDCVWVTKSRRAGSGISVGRALNCDPPAGAVMAQVRTHASAETIEFKEQVREGIGQSPLPAGPVALEISYGVGPGRNWPNLWKPTIDSLAGLLGSDGGRDWHPQDGRITELGLHRREDPTLGHDVEITVAARPAPDG